MSVTFLLDEMLAPAIAEQLVARSIDTTCVSARIDLRTLPDPDILEAAAAEGRILVTANIGDFVRLDAQWRAAGRHHAGILCVATRRFPQDRRFVGAVVTALVEWRETGPDIAGTHAFL